MPVLRRRASLSLTSPVPHGWTRGKQIIEAVACADGFCSRKGWRRTTRPGKLPRDAPVPRIHGRSVRWDRGLLEGLGPGHGRAAGIEVALIADHNALRVA